MFAGQLAKSKPTTDALDEKMWTYKQSSGELTHYGRTVAIGYSGLGEHKNNPASQYIKGLGPIPVGQYHIGPIYDSPNVGPSALPLEALPEVNTHGRGDFKIHGDSQMHPGAASHGCIIVRLPVRSEIALSIDRLLEVIP